MSCPQLISLLLTNKASVSSLTCIFLPSAISIDDKLFSEDTPGVRANIFYTFLVYPRIQAESSLKATFRLVLIKFFTAYICIPWDIL